jgi:hypothetical protein
MRRWIAILPLLFAAAANAQEGFPLDGTWRGDLEGVGKAPVTIVVVMQWDGQKVSGVINPGQSAIQIGEARLTPEGWRVTISAQSADGKPIAFEGTLSELGSYHRAITGRWTADGRSTNLRIVRE